VVMSGSKRLSSASVENMPRTAKRKKLMHKAQPIKPDCTKACTSFFKLIASKPRWMSVTDIERQDKSRHNEERESPKPRISISDKNK
jgi:hypothetical protein